MADLNFAILETGYRFSESAAVSRVQTKGGRSRYRADLSNCAILVNVTFNLKGDDFDDFNTFFETTANFGSAYFTVPLVIDNADLETRFAKFSTPPAITQVIGLNYRVSAVFEVKANTIDLDDNYDFGIVAVYNGSDGQPVPYLNALEHLANVSMDLF